MVWEGGNPLIPIRYSSIRHLFYALERTLIVKSLTDKSNGDGVAVKLAVVRLYCGENRNHDTNYSQRDKKEEPDDDKTKGYAYKKPNEKRDLEIDAFLSMIVDERRLIFFYEP